MDSATSPISFPTIARLPDESERARSKPAPGATASPTFNASWLPQLTSSSLQPRNNLCSLDLASSLPVSKQPSAAPQRESAITKQRSTVFASANSTTFGSPRRQAPTNTPPLTPSSSFASSGGTETDQESTLLRTPPSESSSPDHPRWVKDNTTYLSTSFPNSTHLHPSSPLDADLADFLSSKVGALHLDSHDNDQTPKADKTLHSDSIPHLHPPPSFSLHADNPQLDMDVLFTRPDPPPTNFIAVRPIPSFIASNGACATIQGETFHAIEAMHARFHSSHEVVLLRYSTVSASVAAVNILKDKTVGKFFSGLSTKTGDPIVDDRKLQATWLTADELSRIISQNHSYTAASGCFITIENVSQQPVDVREPLKSFGLLKSFELVEEAPGIQVFYVEYHDPNDTDRAYGALNNKRMFGARLKFSRSRPDVQPSEDFAPVPSPIPFASLSPNPNGEVDISSPKNVIQSLDADGEQKPADATIMELAEGTFPSRKTRYAKTPNEFPIHPPNEMAKIFQSPHMAFPPGNVVPDGCETLGLAPLQAPYGYPESYIYDQYQQPYAPPYHVQSPVQPIAPNLTGFSSIDPYSPFPPVSWNGQQGATSPHRINFPNIQPTLSPIPTHLPAPFAHVGPRRFYSESRRASATRSDHRSSGAEFSAEYDQGPDSAFHRQLHANGVLSDTAKKNELDVQQIEAGLDTRTTVMIKNIPNKMTDKDLQNFIARVCPRRIDFMYLRMDFQNGCNVGYAFVNFITVQDLLYFAKTQLGVKWNMYSSEKVLQMNYATYQGKEALVEKFKNSCIMDEREAWRPKIFYSDGPNQGLSEPFPPPTHLRRKERSAHNRGALYTPGPHYPHANRRYDERQRNGYPQI